MNSFGDCVVVVGLFEIGIKWQISNLGGLWAAHNFLSLEKNRMPLPPTPPSTQLKPGQFLSELLLHNSRFPTEKWVCAAFPPVSPGRTSDGQKKSGVFFRSRRPSLSLPFLSFSRMRGQKKYRRDGDVWMEEEGKGGVVVFGKERKKKTWQGI